MKGHIMARGKDGKTWALIIDIGKDAQGKRRQQWITFHGTKREAGTELARLITEQANGTSVEPNRLTVGEYLQRWLQDYASMAVASQTFTRYDSVVRRHLIPALGGHKLGKLSPLHIQGYYRKALQGTRLDGKSGGLSARTVLQHHRILKEALGQAVKWRLIPNNPAAAVEPPRFNAREMATLTPQQAAVLVEASEGSPLQMPITLAVTTGMRRGEILGLQWKDIDWEGGTLQVRRSLEPGKDAPRFKEPKTASGRRTVALPEIALEALRRHRIRQNEYRLKLGPDYATECDLVCCQFDGTPLRNNVTRDFSVLLKRAGLPRVRFHDLRHTHASLLLASGVHPKVVSERLGHASISITLQIYSHVLPTIQKEAAAKIDTALGWKVGS